MSKSSDRTSFADLALATSTAGALVVSQGAGALPACDADFSWDVSAKVHTLKGQAAGAGGDRQAMLAPASKLRWTDNQGTTHFDAAVAPGTVQVDRVHPRLSDVDFAGVAWNETVQSFSNDGLAGRPYAGTQDQCKSDGWNDAQGSPVVAAAPVMRDAWEFRWFAGLVNGFWFERHICSIVNPNTGLEHRPFSLIVSWNDFRQTTISGAVDTFSLGDNFTTAPREYFRVSSDRGSSPQVEMQMFNTAGGTPLLYDFGPALSQIQVGILGVDTQITYSGGNVSLILLHGTSQSTIGATASLAISSPVGGAMFLASDVIFLTSQNEGTFFASVVAGGLRVGGSSGSAAAKVEAYCPDASTNGFASYDSGGSPKFVVGPAGQVTIGGGTPLKKVLSATATLDFGSVAAQSSAELTIAVTGASVGDSVAIGVPASTNANACFTARVSAADTVTVRFNNYSSGAIDPASGTYRATVFSF